MLSQPRFRWRLLFVPARDGAENMARDLALQDHSRKTGECVFSIYSWIRPTLSLGRNQTAKSLYDLARIDRQGLDVVRRPTGGRAILHDHEITYSVTGPDSFAPTLGQAYDAINAILLAGLRSVGVPVSVASPDVPPPMPDQSPCFAEPVKGELVANGKKLVGSAQYRENGAFLQHGSILISNDQYRLSELTLGVDRDALSSPATLSDLLAHTVDPGAVAEAMFAAVRELHDPGAASMSEDEIRPEALRLRSGFTDPVWTWRR
jgi:lipoyl(octanoyl) transferase